VWPRTSWHATDRAFPRSESQAHHHAVRFAAAASLGKADLSLREGLRRVRIVAAILALYAARSPVQALYRARRHPPLAMPHQRLVSTCCLCCALSVAVTFACAIV
jgi:hypothetical protein